MNEGQIIGSYYPNTQQQPIQQQTPPYSGYQGIVQQQGPLYIEKIPLDTESYNIIKNIDSIHLNTFINLCIKKMYQDPIYNIYFAKDKLNNEQQASIVAAVAQQPQQAKPQHKTQSSSQTSSTVKLASMF